MPERRPSESRSSPPFPVIVGVPRSGTTLLRMMLDSHSELAIPPETGFLLSKGIRNSLADRRWAARAIMKFPASAPAWADFGMDDGVFLEEVERLAPGTGVREVVRLFYRLYAENHGKQRAGDKTPLYIDGMIGVADVLPEAHFIHIIRDGRDVALSWSRTWFAPTKRLSDLVRIWADKIVRARTSAVGLAYREVLYSDLVREPAVVLAGICDFIGLEFEPAMLQYFTRAASRLGQHKARYRSDGSLLVSREDRFRQQQSTTQPILPRLGVWRTEMSEEEESRLDPLARSLLEEIGQRDEASGASSV